MEGSGGFFFGLAEPTISVVFCSFSGPLIGYPIRFMYSMGWALNAGAFAVSRFGVKQLVLSVFIRLDGYLSVFQFSGMDVWLEIPFDPLRPYRAGV
jgi:hypothetical protein